MSLTPGRRDLLPSSLLPAAYFGAAHAALTLALLALVASPDIPGAFFLHPRMAALVHLVTVAWLSGSILGAFYIVAPLALRMPMPVGAVDWAGYLIFVAGAAGMAAGFWTGAYDTVAEFALLALATIGWVALRAVGGLRQAVIGWPVALHIGFAFTNMLAAGTFGVLLGLDRAFGWWQLPPLAAAVAHAHLAAVGWVALMVVGLSYRLLPMMLPAVMPAGAALALSAIFIECGLAVFVWVALMGSGRTWIGGLLIVAGLVSFMVQMRRTLSRRLPRPPALPRRDWSTWQAHAALAWLVVAVALGMASAVVESGSAQGRLVWLYGTAGLVGFLAQIVVGMQGRLVPLYAWYRAMAARGGTPPERAANALPSSTFAGVIFLAWTVGVPLLAAGLAWEWQIVIRVAALVLLAGVVSGAAYLGYLLRQAAA